MLLGIGRSPSDLQGGSESRRLGPEIKNELEALSDNLMQTKNALQLKITENEKRAKDQSDEIDHRNGA
jgi:hypothetical protein